MILILSKVDLSNLKDIDNSLELISTFNVF